MYLITKTGFARTAIAAAVIFCLVFSFLPTAAAKKKKSSPYDVYNHEMHNSIFESAKHPCESCHADPLSYGNRDKINKQGCHACHNSSTPVMPVKKECVVCHSGGFPKPASHRVSWISKHQSYAKNDAASCVECHPNQMFCMDCHSRRDTITERVHRRNYEFYHSIEARANPHKCASCHSVAYCQKCHEGRANSSK